MGVIERLIAMRIHFLHGWQSTPSYLKDHGHTVVNPICPTMISMPLFAMLRPSSTSIIQISLLDHQGKRPPHLRNDPLTG